MSALTTGWLPHGIDGTFHRRPICGTGRPYLESRKKKVIVAVDLADNSSTPASALRRQAAAALPSRPAPPNVLPIWRLPLDRWACARLRSWLAPESPPTELGTEVRPTPSDPDRDAVAVSQYVGDIPPRIRYGRHDARDRLLEWVTPAFGFDIRLMVDDVIINELSEVNLATVPRVVELQHNVLVIVTWRHLSPFPTAATPPKQPPHSGLALGARW
jgi:hypothetical protein